MNIYLQKLFTELKRGDSVGMEIKELFPELTPDQIDQLKNLAENENLAHISTTHTSFGTSWVLELSNEAKQYDTYQEFKDRHKRPQTISNTIIGDVNNSQVGTHDSSFLAIKTPKEYPRPIITPPKTDIAAGSPLLKLWMKLEMKHIISGIIVTIIGGLILWYIVQNLE